MDDFRLSIFPSAKARNLLVFKAVMPNTVLRTILLAAAILVARFGCAQDKNCDSLATMLTVPGKDLQSFVHPLASGDVRIKIGKQKVETESVSPRCTPLNIAIVVDVGSGQNKSTWGITVAALRKLVTAFPNGTKISLVTFDDKVNEEVPLSSGREAVDKALAAIAPSKGKESETTISKAVGAGVSSLGPTNLGDAEILITAWDRGRGDGYRAAEQVLLDAGVRLFVISFDPSELPAMPPAALSVSDNRPTPLGALARVSGGVGIISLTKAVPDNLAKATASVIGDVYVVTTRVIRSIAKSELLTVDVLKSHAVDQPSRVFYPAFAVPCR